jgi:hypothetical protein
MGEGWNIKNDCWLVIAYIGAAYKNREGSPASLFRRCGTSDVRTMNIRNGNSNSAAAPVRPLDPMEREEWSARVSLSLSLSVSEFFLYFFIALPYFFPFFFIMCTLITLLAMHSLLFLLSFCILVLFFSSLLQIITVIDDRFSNLGPQTGYPGRRGYRQPLPAKSWDRRPTRNASFHIHSNLLFTNHPTIT